MCPEVLRFWCFWFFEGLTVKLCFATTVSFLLLSFIIYIFLLKAWKGIVINKVWFDWKLKEQSTKTWNIQKTNSVRFFPFDSICLRVLWEGRFFHRDSHFCFCLFSLRIMGSNQNKHFEKARRINDTELAANAARQIAVCWAISGAHRTCTPRHTSQMHACMSKHSAAATGVGWICMKARLNVACINQEEPHAELVLVACKAASTANATAPQRGWSVRAAGWEHSLCTVAL